MLMKAQREEGNTGNAFACDGVVTQVTPQRARQYERMLASRAQLHTPIPAYDVDPTWNKSTIDEQPTASAESGPIGAGHPQDMATHLARHMTWYVEFPHVDRAFERVYASLPGYGAAAGDHR